ncbi:hypothetical protein MBLNU457_g0373t1 [Dothideomycetes sp. NU457]
MAEIKPLASFTPPSNTRTWSSRPHPNLPILATACSDKTVRIYSLTTFKLLSTVSGGHKRSIRSVAWKPGSGPSGGDRNGIGESVLATGSFDASAGIWRRWEGTSGYMKGADDAEERDFTGGDDEDDDEWRFAVILDGHDSEIKSLMFSPTGPLLATCSRDKSVWIWEEMEDDNFETVAVLQEHEGDVKCVAWHPSEELLASGSYDDSIRLWREDVDDWACCAHIEGHNGTVWWVEFEGAERAASKRLGESQLSEEQSQLLQDREKSGPRLISCSDDLTVRIWRRVPKEKKDTPTGQGRMPSIIKTNSIEEDWYEEMRLPQAHDRPMYSVSWSKETGRIVSAGSDGKIVVYEERWVSASTSNGHTDGDVDMQAATSTGRPQLSEWVVVAQLEDGHDVFEINHVCWAKRSDADRRSDNEEIVVTTGDDGEVKAWSVELSA